MLQVGTRLVNGCYRLHYPRRSAQCIISVKPAQSEATWQLVTLTLARGLMSEGGDVCDCDFRGSDVRQGDKSPISNDLPARFRGKGERRKRRRRRRIEPFFYADHERKHYVRLRDGCGQTPRCPEISPPCVPLLPPTNYSYHSGYLPQVTIRVFE